MKIQLKKSNRQNLWNPGAIQADRSWAGQLQPARQELLSRANVQAGDHVLDIACGPGYLAFQAEKAVGNEGLVVGIDLSQEMIDHTREGARARGLNPDHYHLMHAEQLDFADLSFDLSINALGYMYYDNPLQAAKEQHRVIKPGGRAIAAVWGRKDICAWSEVLSIVGSKLRKSLFPMFFHLGTEDTLARIFWMAGFREISTERISAQLRFASGEEACDAMFKGGPVAEAYKQLSTPAQEEVQHEYLQSIRTFKVNGGYIIPSEFVIVGGSK